MPISSCPASKPPGFWKPSSFKPLRAKSVLVRKVLAIYTKWYKYRQALLTATHRYDLQSNHVSDLEHQQRAQAQLDEDKRRYQERQKAWRKKKAHLKQKAAKAKT